MQQSAFTDDSQLLESMPPVEVFAGVDTLLSLSKEVLPDLPTRAQLNHWLEEHDRTEKETEIFDAEDMSKLKKLTKGASLVHSSPAEDYSILLLSSCDAEELVTRGYRPD
jgi:hypothetical protein